MRRTTLLLLFLLVGCRQEAPVSSAPPPVDPLSSALAGWVTNNLGWLQSAYEARRDGLRDAVATVTPVMRGKDTFLVVVWAHPTHLASSYQADDQQIAPETPPPLVTLAPQMKDWCRQALRWPSDDLYLAAENAVRVNMWLGEPPTTGQIHVVELWVAKPFLQNVGVAQNWSPALPTGTAGAARLQLVAGATYQVAGSYSLRDYCTTP